MKRSRAARWLSLTCSATVLVAATALLSPAAPAVSAAAAATSGPQSGHAAAAECDLYAAPLGSDENSGTVDDPLGTVEQLSRVLQEGDVGCLRGGIYRENVKVRTPGTTLRNFPGEKAVVLGRFWIPRGADGVTVSGLTLDGTTSGHLPSPTINATRTTFTDNEVTNGHTAICFMLGSEQWGAADFTTIERNRIHGCGRLPRTNLDHGIYVAVSRGTVIRQNVIYDNADRGIQLYPDAQETLVVDNVIDRNGSGITFSGEGGKASGNNLVERNVITNSGARFNVESWFPPGNPVGTGNIARKNCLYGGVGDHGNGGIEIPRVGFVTKSNRVVPPQYVNAARGDYRLKPSSRCKTVAPNAGLPAAGM